MTASAPGAEEGGDGTGVNYFRDDGGNHRLDVPSDVKVVVAEPSGATVAVAVEVLPGEPEPGSSDHAGAEKVLLDCRAAVIVAERGEQPGVDAEPAESVGDVGR